MDTKKLYQTYHPKGFTTVNTYLFAENPPLLIQFLKSAFYAEEGLSTVDPDTSDILNMILYIGQSAIMISQSRGQFIGMRSSFYLFTENVDHLYENALNNGGVSEFAPADMDYGDRQAGIRDPAGNYWWISKRIHSNEYED